MSKISTYEDAPLPKLSDKLIGTSVGGEIEDMTYNFTLQELLNVFLPVIPANNLQGILDYGNTATQDINLFGTINTTYINVTDTATILNSNLTGETRILGGLIDSTYSIGEAGQVLSSTGEFVEWVTLPPIFTPSLQQVLEVGNGSDINIILDATLQAFNVDSNTAIINDDLTISGTLTDSDSLVGTANQVLSSTVTGVKWIGLPIYSATSPLLFNSATGVFSIQEAASYQSGYLSSTDWINFDGKQPAGNYITTLIGEASASGPGAASVILNNASVLGKVLTGFNPTSGTINASDTILTAFEKTQSQINALVGGVIYRGTWNASANVPTLTSSVGVQGDYYVVNVAGNTNLNGITDWKVGDWAIFSESVWQKVDNTDSVSSVNGYTGAVNLTTDDIPEGLTNLYYLNSRARAALSATSPLLYDNSTGISSIQQSNNIQDGYLSSTDWVTFNNKQGAITLTTVGSSGPSTLISNTLNIPNYGGALTGYVPYTGATTNVDLGEYGISAGYFQADLTPTGTLQVGRMQWNAIDGTMDLRMMGNNVTLQIGEENVTRVVNKSGINLLESNYQVVRARKVAEGGAQGQRIAVVLAQGNSENNSTEVLGLVTETINTNQEGFITCFGEVKEIDTTGSLQGETWVDGDILYLSSTVAGALTNVRPIAPNHSVIVGYVTYAHAVHGKIYMAIDTGYELGELHNVYAPSPTANQSIYWNAINSRYQLNTIAGILGYTPADAATYVPYTGATTDVNLGGYSLLSASTSSNVFYANGSGLTPGTIYLKKGTVPVNFSGSNGIYANSTSYGFIADTGTSYKLGILSLASLTDATARTYTFPNASGTLALTSDLGGYVPYTGATGAVNLGVNSLSASYLYLNGATTPMSGQLNMKIGTSSPGNQGGYYNILPYSDGKLYFTSYLSSLSNTRIFILDSAGITANTPRIFTFPDASGTLALTSDLAGYLPLTGGTLTGNLSITGTNPALLFTTNYSGSYNGVIGLASATNSYIQDAQNGDAVLGVDSGKNILFGIASFPKLKVTSSNIVQVTSGVSLEVGYTALQSLYKLDVNGTGRIAGTLLLNSTASNKLTLSGGTAENGITFSAISGGAAAFYLFNGDRGLGNGFGIYNINTTSTPFYIANNNAATFSSSVTGVQGIFSASAGTYAGGSLILKSSTGTNPIYLTSNGGFFALSNGGGADHLVIASTGAATFSSSIAATSATFSGAGKFGGDIYNGAILSASGTKSNIGTFNNGILAVIDNNALGTNIGGAIEFRGIYTSSGDFTTSGVISTYKNNATSGDYGYGMQLYVRPNGTIPTVALTLASSGAATFSSSVTAGSFIKTGGTAAQILAANGSNITAGTGITISSGTISASGGGMSIGGSITASTQGSVLFVGSGNVLQQNNTKFYWDDTNQKFSIGTNTPAAISGYTSFTIDGSGGSFIDLRLNGADLGRLVSSPGVLSMQTLSSTPISFFINSGEAMRISTSKNLLIGTITDAGWRLAVVGGNQLISGTNPAIYMQTTYSGNYYGVFGVASALNSYIQDANNGDICIGVDSGRNILLGVAANPKLKVLSSGVIQLASLAGAGSRTVTADASGNLSAASDSSLKQEDKEYSIAGLNEILKLTPRAYKWLKDIEKRGADASTELGFFANEVAPIIPSAAPKSNDGLYGFYDRAVIAALVKGMQEQQIQIEELKLIKNNIN